MLLPEQIKVDLGWGNPYFLLEELNRIYTPKFSLHDIQNMSYAPDGGFNRLKNLTREVILKTTGSYYKYITITNGATNAINCILRYEANKKADPIKMVHTNRYTYPFYEDMVKMAGLSIVRNKPTILNNNEKNTIKLIDSPSNPQGKLFDRVGDANKDIWDAVYHSNIYIQQESTHASRPSHKYMVGSYSKLLGITGSRVGWVATNDMFVHASISNYVLKDLATVSVPSQELVMDILDNIDLGNFINKGRNILNWNREYMTKIEYLFDHQPVNDTGMFYCVVAEDKVINMLEKCGINYVEIDNNYIRLSLGQTPKKIKQAVSMLITEDTK